MAGAMSVNLAAKRVLILGAETEVGGAVTTAVAEAGASVAAVAATSDSEAAFVVQRLARRLSSDERKAIAQAIDATNEAAVRVMVRQVSKELGGLDAVVHCADPAPSQSRELMLRYGGRELDRAGGGRLVTVEAGWVRRVSKQAPAGEASRNWTRDIVGMEEKPVGTIAAEVVASIAGEADSG
jgi:hypothetical protein